MKPIDIALSSLLFLTPLVHLLLSPHTKVEESFNIQAAHDILVYGTPTSSIRPRLAARFDHLSFPGSVPRTFVGALLLAGVAQPFVALAGFRHAQFIVRAALGAFNAASLLVFGNALRAAFGEGTARWWVAFMVGQFHVMYYLSRTLPNMFAFGLTTLAFAFLLPRRAIRVSWYRRKQAVALLTLATTLFRAELAILLAAVGLRLLLARELSLRGIIPVFVAAFAGSLALTVLLDSYFWQQLTWPELKAFLYNTVEGQAANWGTSPWHWYFTSALPRVLLNPLAIPLVAFSLAHPGLRSYALQLALPSLVFVAIYSAQPHKETRFIFYVSPPLTAAAALAANYVTTRASKSFAYRLASLALVAAALASAAASAAMLLLSSLNYPGGDAVSQLKLVAARERPPGSAVAVHADVLTCMTGLTLFSHNAIGLPVALLPPGTAGLDPALAADPVLLVDKTESGMELGWPRFWRRFDYALMEDPGLAVPAEEWETIGVVAGLAGVEALRPGHAAATPVDETFGLGAAVAAIRGRVRKVTGGWWVGPRMVPRIHIMRRVAETGRQRNRARSY
ncbi:hypothetical protein N3K66_002329 [Trichothecium roseum]|uniref:Uncharacterized protein n=1 Tax=Trichothecium roseum TaxID=47278 RepID=A0ACC0VAP9_9HYPO|nr:hypothetical protein N3K66_002329 [Trichothecium roseum]